MRGLIEKYGWKTIVGTMLLAIGEIMDADAGLSQWSPMVKAAGITLGGVGIRVAVTKEKTNA